MSNDLETMKPAIAGSLQPEQMDRHAIMSRALRHGFTLRPQEGRPDDLNEYVYSFAREVFEAGRQAGSAEINDLREDLERERMRLVACGVVALADTPESAAKAREMHQDYRSASCDDVARRVDECIALRKERDALAAKLAELEGQIKDAEEAGMTVNIKAEFSYCKETGFVFHEKKHGKTAKGKRAGSEYKDGYRYVKVNGLVILEHRLAWYLHYGEWPKNQIDHMNMNKADNRISNLRKADFFENNRNKPRQSNNTSGYKGVSFNKRTNRYVARITAGKTRLCLGYFNTAEEAASAYKEAAKEHHHEFART